MTKKSNPKEKIKMLKTDIESISYEKMTLSEVKINFHKWIYYRDEDVIDIVFASAIGERIDGDPLWTFLIAPPGGTKSELLRSFEDSLNYYHLSDLTSKTFVSGLMIGKGDERRKIEDLYPQLDKKTILFKDFTTVLEKDKDERRQILAQLREMYDGFYSKKFGTLDKKVHYKSRFGFIAGVTPIIDQHWKVMQQLGERFLKVRWIEDRDKTTEGAYKNEGQEVEMRKELQNATMGFLIHLNLDYTPKFNDSKYKDKIMKLAKFVAIARTPVAIQDSRSDFYYDFEPMPEQPTRLVKQFKKLIKALTLLHQKEEVGDEELRLAIRVGFDTIPQDRLQILRTIHSNRMMDYGCPLKIIVGNINIPESSVEKILKQLKLLNLIKVTKIDEEGRIRYYYKNEDWVDEVLIYPLTFTNQISKKEGVYIDKLSDDDLIAFVEEKGSYDMQEFSRKYGENRMQKLLVEGSLYQQKPGILVVLK